MEWIKVTDRLPIIDPSGRSCEVIIFAKNQGRFLGHVVKNIHGEIIWRGGNFKEVTHWMPLPPAPYQTKITCQ